MENDTSIPSAPDEQLTVTATRTEGLQVPERRISIIAKAEDNIRTQKIKTQKQLTQPRHEEESVVYRDEIVREMVKTERQYVRDLTILIQLFLLPLKSAGEEAGLLSKEELYKIFSNVETLLKVNEELLQGLEKRTEEWDHTSCVGDIFLHLASFFKLYTVYCKNYGTALETLQHCKTNPRFAHFLEETEKLPDVKKLEITSYLIMPIQRIPRYVLLLKDFLRHTPKGHPDFENISRALALFQDVAVHVNQSIQMSDEMNTMLELQKKFLGKYEVVKPSRRFIRQGKLQKITSRFVKECWFFLFNDALVYAYQILSSYTFKGEIFLGTTWIRDLPDTEVVKHAFQIVSQKKTYTVYASTAQEKEEWITAINGCIEVLVQKRPSLIEHRATVNVRRSKISWISEGIGLTYGPQQFDPTSTSSVAVMSPHFNSLTMQEDGFERLPLIHLHHTESRHVEETCCGCVLF